MEETTKCIRCGDLGVCGEGDARAKPFRRANRGLCTPCAVCAFFQEDSENGIGFALPANFNPNGLLLPHIQQQFAHILKLGRSELTIGEIDWIKVIDKWEIQKLRH